MNDRNRLPKVAIASSGLGYVARGIETWAIDTAAALAEYGIDVTLFAAEGFQLSAFSFQLCILPCLHRFDRGTQRLTRLTPGFMWRWGLKQAYGWEELTFWLRLWPRLRKGGFDILHVQDAWLAFWCRKFRHLGLVRTKEILGHGTEEAAEWLAQFEYVQHLAPWHFEQALRAIGGESPSPQSSPPRGEEGGMPSPLGREGQGEGGNAAGVTEHRTSNFDVGRSMLEVQTCDEAASHPTAGHAQHEEHPHWSAIPNFVDTDLFHPLPESTNRRIDESSKLRKQFGIAPDAFVIGTAATVKRPHKRIDYLIREFAAITNLRVIESSNRRIHLAVAGARTPETDALVAMANELAPGRVTFCLDLRRDQMPDFYRALDVFVLVSLFEMMPIAVLEALASGVPVIANAIPQLQWMVGDEGREGFVTGSRAQGGSCIDLSREGALAAFVAEMTPEWIEQKGRGARKRVLEMFATDVVIGRYVEYYRRVVEADE